MKRAFLSAVCLFAVFQVLGWSQADVKAVYKDPNAAIPDRVRDLVGRMTVEEKVAQLQSGWNLPSAPGQEIPSIFDKGRLNEDMTRKLAASGLGTYAFLDEFTGLETTIDRRRAAQRRNLLQSWVIKNTRFGIPILFHGEALHGAVTPGATSFPQAVALGSTWHPELIEEMFSLVAREVRAGGNALVLSPVVLDLSRDPRFGRVEEMFSEDPYLVAQLGIAAVRGLQGTSDRFDENHVMATAKHFVHGQPENGTNVGPSDYSERTMRSVFLYPFEEVVKKAKVAAVMPSYNETMGGIPSHGNSWLLRDVLRKEWGFTGLTVSDYTGVEQLALLQRVVPDKAAAGVLALKSGVDMELPFASAYPSLVDAVQSGKVSQQELDEAVSRVLAAKFRAGLFEHPYVDEQRAIAEIGNKDHAPLARRLADEAIVLLKNDANLLPLDPAKVKTLAVIGPNADKQRQGTYASVPPYFVTVLEGIQKRVGAGIKVVHAEGCRISEPDAGPIANFMTPYQSPQEEADRKLMQQALETAKAADVIVLVLGGNESVSRESIGDVGQGRVLIGDSDTLELPGRQGELAHEIARLGKPTVAVLLNGKAYAIERLASETPAIVEGWYLGQETGNAVAGVLFGDVNPSGHLPVSIPRNVGQLPVYYYKTPAARRGYVFGENTPLFPFGHGLSYTTFTYGKPVVDREQISMEETAKVSITVTNAGSRAGDDVVQMYVHHPVSSVVQPVIALRGFKRVHLEPGASTTVTFDVGPEQLSIVDAQMRRTVEPGPVEIRVGASSAQTSSVRLTVSEAKQ